jgi:tetratricopeptide (TPR) repeat protein
MTPEQSEALDKVLATAQASDAPSEEISVIRKSLRGGRTLSMQNEPHGQTPTKTASPLLSRTLFVRGEYALCAKDLVPAISSLPDRELSLLVTCAFYTGDFNTALSAAKRLRRSPRTEEEGLFWSILAQQRLALLALSYAGEVEPNSVRLHELLAESYRDRERYADAEAEYQISLDINPKEFAALIGSATNYLQELKIDHAREMIQKALVLHPADAEANYIMGEVLIAEHKFSESEPYLRAGLSAKTELVPRIHALLGQVYAFQGDTKRAIDEYKLGLSSDDDGSVHFQLGRLYQKTGEKELAANAFAESKTLNQRKRAKTISDFGIR